MNASLTAFGCLYGAKAQLNRCVMTCGLLETAWGAGPAGFRDRPSKW